MTENSGRFIKHCCVNYSVILLRIACLKELESVGGGGGVTGGGACGGGEGRKTLPGEEVYEVKIESCQVCIIRIFMLWGIFRFSFLPELRSKVR